MGPAKEPRGAVRSNGSSRCYVPVRSKYLEQRPTAAAPILTAHGNDEVDWIGSHVYRTVPGFYDTLEAGISVPGIPVNLARDTDRYWNDTSGSIEHGIPYCNAWWAHPSDGLRALQFVQALTLMGIYALLPLVLVFGMYQPSIPLIGTIGIFTVKFWAVLWHSTLWVDSKLFQS